MYIFYHKFNFKTFCCKNEQIRSNVCGTEFHGNTIPLLLTILVFFRIDVCECFYIFIQLQFLVLVDSQVFVHCQSDMLWNFFDSDKNKMKLLFAENHFDSSVGIAVTTLLSFRGFARKNKNIKKIAFFISQLKCPNICKNSQN